MIDFDVSSWDDQADRITATTHRGADRRAEKLDQGDAGEGWADEEIYCALIAEQRIARAE